MERCSCWLAPGKELLFQFHGHWRRAISFFHILLVRSARIGKFFQVLKKILLFLKLNLFFKSAKLSKKILSIVHHEVSVFPERETPFFIMFTAGLCTFTALIAFLTHQYPDHMAIVAKTVSKCVFIAFLTFFRLIF